MFCYKTFCKFVISNFLSIVNIALKDLKKYRDNEVFSLKVDVEYLKLTEAEIDKRLDRINEIEQMIIELEIKQGV